MRRGFNCKNVHLVVEHLGLAGGGVGDEGLVEDVENILADLLKLKLDLAAVLLDGGNVLVGALGLLLLLDRRDDSPRGTAGTNDVLVGNAEEVALVDGELTTELGHLLHVGDHLIVALGLLAEAGEEGLAVFATGHKVSDTEPSFSFGGVESFSLQDDEIEGDPRSTTRKGRRKQDKPFTLEEETVSIIVNLDMRSDIDETGAMGKGR